MWKSFLGILPRGNTLAEADWQRRHRLLRWVLLAHVPALAFIGVALDNPLLPLALALAIAVGCAGLGLLLRHHRRWGSGVVTAGLVWCSVVLVGITGGSIEAHFHFFIIIGFIALYQDWVPFLLNVLFTVISHGVGSTWLRTLMFNHPAAQSEPWLWSLLHGVAVLLACIGVMLFWRVTEDEQSQKDELTRRLADAEIGRRRFTSDMLVNLARRNQSMLYRQLEIINQLEEAERNPDVLAELFRLDHLTTRVRRNAENLLVLSGEKPPRVWSQPVPLRDVVRAAIAETEDLDRVVYEIPEGSLVDGASVTDVTHLLAELTENAVRFSPPDQAVTVRARHDPRGGQAQLVTVEDWGVGMEPAEMAAANALLSDPPEVDLSVAKRLGFHVVARLAARHGIRVILTPTPGTGVTASVTLPGSLFQLDREPAGALVPAGPGATIRPNRSVPSRTAPNRAEPNRAEPNRAEPNRAEPNRAEPNRAEPNRAEPPRPAPRRAAPNRAVPTRAGDRTGPGRAGSAGTGPAPGGPTGGADVRLPIPAPRAPEPDPVDQPPAAEAPGWSQPSWKDWWLDPEGEPAADPAPDPAAGPAAVPDPGVADFPDTPELLDTPDGASPLVRGRGNVSALRPTSSLGQPADRRPESLFGDFEDVPARDPEQRTASGSRRVVPVPAPRDGASAALSTWGPPTDAAGFADDGGTERPTLHKRVPQARLAPGLRLSSPDDDVAGTDALPDAADALSRYQASRASAQALVDGMDEGGRR
jgi:signal transduction histidine kinase